MVLCTHAQESIAYIEAAEAAALLAGPNVTVFNATYSGHPNQLARLNNGSETLGVDEALAMTTGKAMFAATNWDGTVSGQSNLLTDNTPETEPDLNLIDGATGGHYNIAILEFDFQTTAPAIVFNYVFASKEYPDYIGSGYNDVFGFFISGPNINGPFSNNAVNIATIDGDPVSINTIHGFSPDTHPELYVAGGPNNPGLAYDGRTVLIQATLNVACNQTYHAKLALCNVGDSDFHTGVFIQSHTLSSPYVYPGSLTLQPIPVCEGSDLNLTVGGDPAWTYTWSTGASGVGLQQISTTASTSVSDYSVEIEYLEGCSFNVEEAQRAVVHPLNNVPPYCTGINGGGGVTYVGQALDPFCFTLPTADNPDEPVTIAWDAGVPGSFSDNGAFQETGTFCWTPGVADIGFHSFNVTLQDENVCGFDTSQFGVRIKIVCAYCPVSVFYERRSPTGLPLPELTEAGWRIRAGTSVDPTQTDGPVSTGDANVTFRAPNIELMPGFTGGPGFLAIVDGATCVEDCDVCCTNWQGFTADTYEDNPDGPLGNWFQPDGDGFADCWNVLDLDNPFCAYGAMGFNLTIYSGHWGNPVWHLEEYAELCCEFQSRAPENQIPHSSIYWDGTANTGVMYDYGALCSSGYYTYDLTLYGCTGDVNYHGLVFLADDSEYPLQPVSSEAAVSDRSAVVATGGEGSAEGHRHSIRLFPNPSRESVNVVSATSVTMVQVLDAIGNVLVVQPVNGASTLNVNLSTIAAGQYVLQIQLSDGRVINERFVKL